MLTSSMRFRARNSPSLLTFMRTPPAMCDFWPYFWKLQRPYKNTLNYKSNSFTFQTCKPTGVVGFIKSTALNCQFYPAFEFLDAMIEKFWAHLTSNWVVNTNSDILVVPCMPVPPLFYLLNERFHGSFLRKIVSVFHLIIERWITSNSCLHVFSNMPREALCPYK